MGSGNMGSKKKNPKGAITTTNVLKKLWQDGFFRVWRTSGSILEHLSEKGYNFPPPTVRMALKAATYLTRRGKRGAYEYIQKHPFSL